MLLIRALTAVFAIGLGACASTPGGEFQAGEARWNEATPAPRPGTGRRPWGSPGPRRCWLYRSLSAQNLLTAYRALGEDERAARLEARQADPFGLALIEGMEVEEVPASRLFLAPNVVDADGTPAIVHSTRADMPLRVAIGSSPAHVRDQTPEETARLAIRCLQIWEGQIRRLYPWFELSFVDSDPEAAIQVEWKTRGHFFLPAFGEIRHHIDGGRLGVRGLLTLAPQPIPGQDTRVDPRPFTCFLADLPFINNGEGDQILIDLSPDPGRPLPVQVDTGATTGLMSLACARTAGVAARKIRSDQYRRLTVTGEDFRFWVMHDRHSAMHVAVLGGEYLMEYVVELDFAEPDPDCPSRRLAIPSGPRGGSDVDLRRREPSDEGGDARQGTDAAHGAAEHPRRLRE